ncbi:CPBP family intramembrane glutamic endopeptidase [Nostoc sp. MG11]|uniref:CPBP family intramembrane glutamic endopeptidase n=1 Tax=Nostoc sp. MG11 TaxID=2721166 RepID=UPI001868528C|nr:CPBP family intramembrane glutamic endopeptidase [Nostoc sp. MG11]
MTDQNLDNPFRKLKVRNLLLRGLLISLSLGFTLGFIQGISGFKFNNQVVPLILYILIFGLLCLWELADFKRFGINLKYVVGRVPKNHKWLNTVGLVILTILFSLSAFLVSFYLLLLVAPSFVEGVLRQVATNPSPRSTAPLFDNLLAAIVYVVIGPITEEFLFRGIILQRWAAKWGIRSALVISSLLFGILHANVLGLSIFGIIMGVLYIKTRTLIVPIACHALNNFLAVTMGLFSSESNPTSAVNSLEQLRSNWWLGVLLMLVTLPLLVRFLSQNWPRRDAAVPYLVNAYQDDA